MISRKGCKNDSMRGAENWKVGSDGTIVKQNFFSLSFFRFDEILFFNKIWKPL